MFKFNQQEATSEEIKEKADKMTVKQVSCCKKSKIFWCIARIRKVSGWNPLNFLLYQAWESESIPVNAINFTHLWHFRKLSKSEEFFSGLYEWNGKTARIIKLF